MNELLASGLFLVYSLSLSLSTTTYYVPDMSLEAPEIVMVATSTQKWIDMLSMCESGGKWDALNPMDLDGTPSKGKFQFKDQTFNYFSDKYDIATTSIWNGDEQELILREMIKDEEVDLSHQFPDCVRKLGLPESVVSE